MRQIELVEKRKPREKHFLQEDGTIIATIYDSDVHYLKDGKYEEINNELIKEEGCYVNKANSYKTIFKETSCTDLMTMEKSNHYLNIKLKDKKRSTIKKINTESNKIDGIRYENIDGVVDIEYKMLPSKVKESIILKNRNQLPPTITFDIETDLTLLIENDKSISAIKDGKKFFSIAAPFMIDNNGNINNNIYYKLSNKKEKYELLLCLDIDWLNDLNTTYPVIIDPTITNENDDIYLWDTYIYQGDTYVSRGSQDILKAGVERVNGIDTINRTLIQFTLPTIGTGSQIIDAKINLTGYLAPANTYDSDIVEIHRITQNWNENDANWANMYDKFDPKVETCFNSQRSFLYVDNSVNAMINSANITDIVKRWYTDTDNFGIMLKQCEEVYKTDYYPAFFSKNNSVSGFNPKPLVQITYRNQNGLEDYMKYIDQHFTDGSTMINSYNGNMVTAFKLGEISDSKMPIVLKLIYNTNDVVIGNNIGYGVGYMLNLSQKVEILNSSSNQTYLAYTDEDGTIHYYYPEKEIYNDSGSLETISENNTFFDEDGLESKIVLSTNGCVLYDKNGSELQFTIQNNVGKLSQIVDSNGNYININYTNDLISSIVDNNMSEISLTYNSNSIIINSPFETRQINRSDGRITSLNSMFGTTYFEYDNNGLISSITDVNGKKNLYEYYDNSPYRAKKVSEVGINNTIGSYFNLEYNFESTTIVDNNNKATTFTFNKFGNVASISNLKSKQFLPGALGFSEFYGQYYQDKNKLLSSSLPIGHIRNILMNSSFEYNNNIFINSANITSTISDDYSFTGKNSLKLVSSNNNQYIYKDLEIDKGKYYTFSGYFKNTNNISIELSYINGDNEIINSIKNIDIQNTEFERYFVTIYYPSDAASDLTLKVILNETGTCYIDDVQLEEGEVANNYNLFDNSDFSKGLDGWNTSAVQFTENGIVNVNDRFEVVNIQGNTSALKIKMHPKYSTSLNKTIEMSGNAGDNYTLSFWYKNEGIITESDQTFNNSIVNFEYEYGQDSPPSFQLNTCRDEWQYFSYTFYAQHDYTRMWFSLFQDFNANDLYITNISLYKNVKESLYNYDVDGNITSITGLDGETNEVDYDSSNQLTSIKNPGGGKIFVEYDNNKKSKVLSTLKNDELATNIIYDNNENPIINININKGNLIDNNIYKLRFKGTDNCIYMINNNILIENVKNTNYCWKIESVVIDDKTYYKIKHSIISDKYITANNSNLMLSAFNNSNSLFEFKKQKNGSYLLKNKNNNLYVFNNNGNICLAEYVPDDYNFEIYIENDNSNYFIETDAEYTNSGKYQKTEINELMNTTYYSINENTGLKTSETNAKGVVQNITYDNKRRISGISSCQRSSTYDYNNQNMLSKITNSNREYNFLYDEFLNLQSVKVGNDVTLLTNSYNSNGDLESITFGNNNTESYIYDDYSRINQINKMDDTYKFRYDNHGQLAKVLSNNYDATYQYDISRRLHEFSLNGFKAKYSYDCNGNINNKKYALNSISNNVKDTFDNDNNITKTEFENSSIDYTYDNLGRIVNKQLDSIYDIHYDYINNGRRTSSLIKNISNNGSTYSYKYDKLNNITHIYHNGNLEHKYSYNEYNELIREDDYITNSTIRYKYDNNGNIISKKYYVLNTFDIRRNDKYKYENSSWSDLLTNFNGNNISYDAIGNPISIGNNISLSWKNGTDLVNYTNNNITVNYKYNYDGLRMYKEVNGVKTEYFYDKNKLIYQKTGNNIIYFIRNQIDELIGFKYNANLYFYEKNLHGDIIGIVDSNYNLVIKYNYDSWGNIISIINNNNVDVTNDLTNIANINPFRYRGYYFDIETGFYYLDSRYYNPEWCRFISKDIAIANVGETLCNNMFQYAFNNPITYCDDNGSWPKWLKKKNLIKIGIGLAAVTIGVVATVATGGAALPAIIGAAKVVATAVVASVVWNTTKNVVTSIVENKGTSKVKEDAFKNTGDAVADGILAGGLIAGSMMGTQAYLQEVANRGHEIGKTTLMYNTPNTPGGTIISMKNLKRFHLDLDTLHGLHFHIGTGKAGKVHHIIIKWLFGPKI